MSFTYKKIAAKLFNYFIKGMLLLAPVSITCYIIIKILYSLDDIFYFHFRGLGLLVSLAVIMLVGFIGTTFIAVPVFRLFEGGLSHLPLVRLIYFSLKDLVQAFVGDKKKFSHPVMFLLNPDSGVRKIGFITQADASFLDIEGYVLVYCPHSYAFSGEVLVVPKAHITPLNIPSSDVMKMIISGGISLTQDTEGDKK